MKKSSLFAVLTLLFVTQICFAQQGPTLLTHADFESGIPAGWTVSDQNNVVIYNNLSATGNKSVRMIPNSGEIVITSPVFQIPAGCATRLEFSHIPILNNQSGGRVEVKKPNGTWATLSLQNSANPNCYDPSYGSGVFGFDGSFKKVSYWAGNTNIPVEDLDSTYWRNEIFYLYSTLTASATDVQIRFVVPATSGAAANFSGWFIDDVRLFVANVVGDEVRVPQIRSVVKAPNIENYPTCNDVVVQMQIRDAGGAMASTEDAVKIEFLQTDETGAEVPGSVNMTLVDAATNTYEGLIPFNGFGETTFWRVIATDSRGNQVRYPYVYGTYIKYTIVRPCELTQKIQETQTSNQELMLPTNKMSSMFQMRYSAEELTEAGFSAGEIGGLYYTLTQSNAGFGIPNFNVYIGNIDPEWVLDQQYQYQASTLKRVYNSPLYSVPAVGEHYIEFEEPFLWDGVSDIMIKTCWGTVQNIGGVTKVECISASGNYRTGQFTQTGTSFVEPCSASLNPAEPLVNYKVNFKFDFLKNCILPVDAALSESLAVPADQHVNANTNTNFSVYIRNDGSEPLSQVKVNYTTDDGSSGNAIWNGTVAPDDSIVFNVTSSLNLTPGYRKVTAWTEILPPSVDWNRDNDTIVYEVVSCDGAMNGNYAIGNVTGVPSTRTFESFGQVFKMLEVCGVGAPVTIKVAQPAEGVFSDVLRFPTNIQGASATNMVTFTSATATPVKFYVGDTLYGVTSAFDLSGSKFLRFENIAVAPAMCHLDANGYGFMGERTSVQMSQTTSNIEFKNCQFPASFEQQPSYVIRPTSIIDISAASNITVDSCRFGAVADKVINVKGLSPTSMSSGITIKNNAFEYESVLINSLLTVSDNIIYAEYNNGLQVFKNVFTSSPDISTVGGEKYALMIQSSKNFDIRRNEFSLEKITAISLSQALAGNSKIANNKIGINNNNSGVGNIHISAIKLLSGQNVDIVYNNIYALDESVPGKQATALNLGSQGQSTSSINVKNNLIVSDGSGYAVWTKPSGEGISSSFTFSNNMYYKTEATSANPMFRNNTSNITDVAQWPTISGETNSYYTINPFFAAWNDLNSTNTSLCNTGVPITGVTEDFFGRPRPSTTPCIGALEFEPPTSNIYVMSASINNGTYSEAQDGTPIYTSCDFGQETVTVSYKNISSNTIPANTARMYYKINNGSPVNGGYITHAIAPNTDYTFTFTQTANFATTTSTTTKTLTVYSSLTADTVNTNDTTRLIIISNYQLPAMANQTVNVNYGEVANLAVTSNDSIYWYKDPNDDLPFLKSHSLTTTPLYSDTVFYFSAKQEIPVLKITELQFDKTATVAEGITSPLPSWITTANAYEISNFGDGDLDMTGYKFIYYSGTNTNLPTSATKTYNFPDNYILPANSSVVLLPVSANSVEGEEGVLGIGTGSVAVTRKVGFVLKNPENTVVDAVAVNGGNFVAAHNVPATMWSGASANLTLDNTAGIVRTSANATTQAGWTKASATTPMTLGTYNSSLTVHPNNGCLGNKATYNVSIQNVPTYNPGIVEVSVVGMESESACTLGDEQIKVKITNMGLQPISNIPITYYSKKNNAIFEQKTDTYTETIIPYDTVEYVLAGGTLNLASSTTDQTFEIFAVANLDTDLLHDNDSSYIEIVSLKTPLTPLTQNISIPYASSATLTAESSNQTIWYDTPESVIELSRNTYDTPILYETDTFYVAALLENVANEIVGTGTTTNSNDAAPTPFAYSKKQVKEQYLWKAEELSSLGEGIINSLGFKVKSESADVTMTNYTIKIGTTSENDLTTWITGLEEVYTGSITITKNPVTAEVWKDMTFATPFYYDGVSNLVVEICFNTTTTTGKVKTYNTSTDFVSTIVYHDNTNNACQYSGAPSADYEKRPNVKFGINKYGCKSERAPLVVTVAPPPACEVGLTEVVAPQNDEVVMSGISVPIQVELKNFGTDALTAVDLHWSINGVEQTVYNWTGNLVQDATEVVTIGNYTFTSGEVELIVWLVKDCDTEPSNDTVQANFSSCIGNSNAVTTITIGQDATDDYATISALLNNLTSSGVCGPIIVNLKQGTYNEQLTLPGIAGLSETNFIKFVGLPEDNSQVILTYTPAADSEDKYVLNLNGVENIHFENFTIQSSDTTANTIINIENSSNVSFNEMNFESAKTMSGSMLTVSKSADVEVTDNTFVGSAIQFAVTDTTTSLTIDNNQFLEFGISGISLREAEEVFIRNNYLSTDTSKYIAIAIDLANLRGDIDVLANSIYMKKGSAVRTGISLKQTSATQIQPVMIANNSISLIGPRFSSSALAYVGIDIDTVDWVNVYYNSVYVEPSKGNSTASKCLAVGKVGSNIFVQNNNLDNRGKGYALHVQTPGTQVVLSNNNNYYTNGSKFTYWISDKNTLQLLQTANSMDAQSVSVENTYVSDSVLGLTFPSDIVRVAEPIDDIATDIEGNFRPVSPKPTIGAYEYQFAGDDTGIPRIINPIEGDEYVEGDPLTVEVELKNYGNYSISSVQLVAELKSARYSETAIQTITETWTGLLASLQTTTYTFTQTFTPPLNDPYTEDLYVVAYTIMDGDTVPMNDTAYTFFLSIPAKDLKLDGTVPITERCVLTNVQIKTKIKNVGERNIEPGDQVELTYWIEDRPDIVVTENLTFPYVDAETGTTFQNLQPGASLTFAFNQTANLYPLGDEDVTWRLWTCVKTVGDNQQLNDTASSAKVVNSKVSPPAPTVTDDYIPYGTWGHPQAEQENNLVIKWYSDNFTDVPFYAPSSYNASKSYTTSQLFADTTFYVGVNATGAYPCASERTPVTVHLDPRADIDASAVAVVEPPADAWVYMTLGDTIKVKLTNFGTQPISNIPVSYSIKPTTPTTAEATIVNEVCPATIQPNQQYVYSFTQLADMSNHTKTYAIRAWTDMPGDYTALNDTTNVHNVKPKNGETLYGNPAVSDGESLDITRVQLGTLDNPSTPSGNTYTNYTADTNVVIPVLYKGVPDQMDIHVENSTAMDPLSSVGAWACVWIDWNRDGFCQHSVSYSEWALSDTAYSGSIVSSTVNVPANTVSGLTRMRVILKQGGNGSEVATSDPFLGVQRGEIEDYKVLIKTAEPINAELKRFVNPTELSAVEQTDVAVMLRNAGLQPLTSATITCLFNGQEIINYSWNGNLASGQSQVVTIGNIDLELGMNNLKAFVDVTGDQTHDNDTVTVGTYIFRTFTVPYSTEFDEEEGNDHFYAYNAIASNPTNCWEMGVPDETNTVIKTSYSEPNCWKTKLSGKHPKNNESILYTPIFDVNIVKPDTLSFMMRMDAATSNAKMYVEYLNWEGKWVLLGSFDDDNAENWYNSEENYWQGTRSWTKVVYSLKHLNYMFGNQFQLRFVFRSANGIQKDGFAIDDFSIQRAQREQDAGVVSLVLEPTALPNYGSNYYPKVGIHNYGTQVLDNVEVCYVSEGMYIPICEQLTNAGIEPGTTQEYTFQTGTYLTVDSPDPFDICSFTRLNPTDVYSDNDSICQEIVIGPLQKDVGIISINSPNAQIVSNDQIEVAIQIRNYGLDPVTELPVAYNIPGNGQVSETIYFNPPLYNGDEYVYRFNQTFRSSFGAVNLKCWTGLEGDFYHDNDTIYKRLEGVGTTKDLEAKYVTIDDADPDNIALQLAIMNRSSVGVGNITVGYFINGDRDNMVTETYRLGNVLPAGSYGYHKFEATLPRANAPYARISAFISVPDENDRTNDTTSVLYMGYRDGVADSILIEQTHLPDCKVQLKAHNGGTIGGTTQVRAHLVLNGDFANRITEDFVWEHDEPNPNMVRYMNFTQRIPKSEDGNYNIMAWIEYPYDADHRNDTTHVYAVRSYVGLEDAEEASGFVLEQNQPNPFENETTIGFTLPQSGEAVLTITNNLGQVVKTIKGVYRSGHNMIVLKDLGLPEGVYYYTMFYNNEKQVKKMIIAR